MDLEPAGQLNEEDEFEADLAAERAEHLLAQAGIVEAPKHSFTGFYEDELVKHAESFLADMMPSENGQPQQPLPSEQSMPSKPSKIAEILRAAEAEEAAQAEQAKQVKEEEPIAAVTNLSSDGPLPSSPPPAWESLFDELTEPKMQKSQDKHAEPEHTDSHAKPQAGQPEQKRTARGKVRKPLPKIQIKPPDELELEELQRMPPEQRKRRRIEMLTQADVSMEMPVTLSPYE